MNRRPLGIGLLVVVLVLAAQIPVLAATGELDQAYESNNINAAETIIYGQAAAQTFTAGKTGHLTHVAISGYEHSHVRLSLELRAVDAQGAPTGTLTPGSGTIFASSTQPISGGVDWLEFHFALPPQVTEGTMYALVALATDFVGVAGWYGTLEGG